MIIKKVAVLGLGKVGKLVATLLSNTGFDVTGIDSGDLKQEFSFAVRSDDVTNRDRLQKILYAHDAVVSCLPYHLNKAIAEVACQTDTHYFDLTEDFSTTNHIRQLAADANIVMAPQCGLAPGFIGIVGASLAKKFSKIRSIELRVGALPQHPKGDLGYAFNWSAEGVVNEYLNDCQVIKDGSIKMVPSMQDLENIVIQGRSLEAFTTSGGLGTMCETYDGKVEELNYKTMRYPGHMKLMRFYFHELMMKKDRIKAGEILVNAKPPVNDDIVYVHAAVEGYKGDNLFRDEFVKSYKPIDIDGESWRAISWTTACSIASVVEMVAREELATKGFIKQEEILLEDFLATRNGGYYNAQ
ncbi:saccharopine dehydrogenase NADP-binding domain-containing protein [Rickettsiales bacterium]|nr:saccharopine dehydrogenase NADP-binding domain-containing protein [Rickettsiales bacterium]